MNFCHNMMYVLYELKKRTLFEAAFRPLEYIKLFETDFSIKHKYRIVGKLNKKSFFFCAVQ